MQSATIFFILVGLLVIFQETEGAAAVKRLVGGTAGTSSTGPLKPHGLPDTPPTGWRYGFWWARKILASLCTVNTYLAYLPFQ